MDSPVVGFAETFQPPTEPLSPCASLGFVLLLRRGKLRGEPAAGSQRGIWAGTSAKRGARLGSSAPRWEPPLFWVLAPARRCAEDGHGQQEAPLRGASLPTPIYASGAPANGFPLRCPGTVCSVKASGGTVAVLGAPETDTPPATECSRSLFCLAR